jgi:hypothetical protein
MDITSLYAAMIIVIMLVVIYVGLFFVIAEIKSDYSLSHEENQSE